MAYLPWVVFCAVVLPVMVKRGSVMFGISTYAEQDNFFTKLISQTNADGSPMFKQIEYSTICKKCFEKGIKNVCKHNKDKLPHWHDAEEYAILFKMMENNSDIAMREIGGISTDSSITSYFDPLKTSDLVLGVSIDGKTNYVVDLGKSMINTIFIAIDPCGGGKHSEYGLISCVFSQTQLIVRSFSFFFYFCFFFVCVCVCKIKRWNSTKDGLFPISGQL